MHVLLLPPLSSSRLPPPPPFCCCRLTAPAELVPDSADLYMGADLLNRFFGSWMGDAQGKSPLEAARNVIVTYLTGPGLKVLILNSVHIVTFILSAAGGHGAQGCLAWGAMKARERGTRDGKFSGRCKTASFDFAS